MDRDGLPPATPSLTHPGRRSYAKDREYLEGALIQCNFENVDPWLPPESSRGVHYAKVLAALWESAMEQFPRQGKQPWNSEAGENCTLILDIHLAGLNKVAALYDTQQTRPPDGVETFERTCLAKLFPILGLVHAWLEEEGDTLKGVDVQCLEGLARRCIDAASGMMRFLGSSLTFGEDLSRPAWEALKPCAQELVNFISDVITALDSLSFPLEISLFTVPRIYEAGKTPEPPAVSSFPVASASELLNSAVEAIAILVSSLASPLSSDGFLRGLRRSTALVICDILAQLEIRSEPKILARLLGLTAVWLQKRPNDCVGISSRVWRVVMERIQSEPGEAAWVRVDEELAQVVPLLKIHIDLSSAPDLERVFLFCASHGTRSALRTSLCHLLAARVDIIPQDILRTFQTASTEIKDASQPVRDLSRTVDSRLQSSDLLDATESRKRKRDDLSSQATNASEDVVMQEARSVDDSGQSTKSISFEKICSTVFGGHQSWLVGGLGPADEKDEAYQERVVNSLIAELEGTRPLTTDPWAVVPCLLAHATYEGRGCPMIRNLPARTVLGFVDLCLKFSETPRPAFDGLALALKHMQLDGATRVIDGLVLERILVLLENGLERPERGIRLAAGRAMAQFIAVRQTLPGDPEPLTARPLAILTRLACEGKSSIQETALSTLCDVGKVASEFVLGRVIMTHIILLQQQNVVIKGLAYTQILELASHANKVPFQLLSPYFKLIAPLIIGKLLSSPGLLSDVCQILAVDRRDFLTYIKAPALLAAVKSLDIRVVDALGAYSERNPGRLLTENPEGYLTDLLLLDDESTSQEAMSFLCQGSLSKYIREQNRNEQMTEERLLKACVAPLLAELAMHLGSEDKARRDKALWAINYVARQITSERGAVSTPAMNIAEFLMTHMLGILIHINDTLQDVRGKTTISQKNQVLRSFGEVIELVGPQCNSVSPQIMATLQSMLRIDELAEATLSVWHTFIRTLSLLDAAPLLSVTTASAAATWRKLSPQAKEWIVKILNYLIVDNYRETKGYAETAISLSDFDAPELKPYNRVMKKLRPSEIPLDVLLARSSDENITVATQSLAEVRRHMQHRRGTIEEHMDGDVFNPILARTMKVLFEAACREGEGSEQLRPIAYECIGIVGALDPDRLNPQSSEQTLMVMHNFEDEEEAIWFTIKLISDVLVVAFKSTTNLKYQRYLGWAIQELVKQCGFTSALLRTNSNSVSNKIRARWRLLSPEVMQTISPFLEARFALKNEVRIGTSFPVYTNSQTHREWIQTWTAYLIGRLDNPRAFKIFEPFLLTIKHEDVRVAKQLLPHLIIIISQSSEDSSHLLQEIVTVLQDQADSPDAVTDPRKALSAQTIFDLMDHLSKWIRKKNQEIVSKRAELRRGRARDHAAKSLIALLDNQRAKAESLLSAIDARVLSDAAFRCRAFARALMSLEKDIAASQERNKSEADLQPSYERLHEIYANLDEPDGMEGASNMIISPSLDQQIRGHEMTGRWTSAQSCWEIKLQQQPNSLEPHVGLVRCLRNLGHNDTMMTHIHGVLSRHPTWEPHFADFCVEGAWKLGNWDVVERLTADPQRQSPEITIGRLLLEARRGREAEFRSALASARNVLGSAITANGPTSYRRSYDAVLHLHLAREIENIHSAAGSISRRAGLDEHEDSRAMLREVTRSLSNRFRSTLPSFRVQEPVLSMRRTTFDLFSQTISSLRHEVGRAWLTSSKIAMKAAHHQTAYGSILQAQQNGMTFSFIQGCKLTKILGEPLQALQELTHSIQNVPNMVVDLTDNNTSDTDPPPLAKALLLRARWMYEADRYVRNDIITEFYKASENAPGWESPYFRLGQYYDESFKRMDSKSQASTGLGINVFTCKNYVEAMRHGSKYIFQTMPRLLTIWLDLAQTDAVISSEQSRPLPPGSENIIKAYKDICASMQDALAKLQAYQWFTALPQLLSRVAHPNRTAYSLLSRIITKIVIMYPQQALWGVAPLVQSRNADRSSRGKDILERARSQDKRVGEIIQQSVAMVKELLHMSECDTPDNEFTLSIKKHFTALARLAPSCLIMPLQEYLTVSLPPSNVIKNNHQPFPLDIPTFHKFHDEVEIMRSLQKPRKISALSETGVTYIFLCKPKDDLRKDARLMDLNTMINKLLKKNAESRRRQLHIRTYAVTILNEDCGFLEWVPNTVGYRHIVTSLYEQRAMIIQPKHVQEFVQFKVRGTPDAQVRNYWINEVIPKVLINLHEYFASHFSEPTAWLASRLAYTRTAAVMSMVGHVLGLGDRHGENLLFDTTNGDVVHVDFNCLFERGTTFEIPEVVPFRLTANMVDGFGVTGVEGAFRTACEVTMQLLRDNYGPLISVLDAFVHDPLVEWQDQKRRNERDARQNRLKADRRSDSRGKASSGAASTDIKELARNAMLPIGRKLQGLSREGRTMTVSNQVEALIREATDPVRLARMYVGWMSWI